MVGLMIDEIMEATHGKILGGDSRVMVADISTDSRKISPGSLFIALKGEKFDGNDFIADAFANGAAAAMTDRDAEEFPGKTVIKVEDTLKALHDLASHYRDRFSIPFVGITGSVGKTSTKDMVACALGARFNVLKNEGNLNNEIGVPLTIFRLEPGHEAAVIEMGMSGFGEIRALTRIVKPKVGIITNIGLSHIEKLGSRQDILRAKLELLEGLQPDGVLILNGDDVMLSGVKDLLEVRTVSYGLEEDADYQAYNIRSKGEKGTDFNIKLGGNEYDVHVPAPGVHNVYNALAALAAGHELGVPAELLVSGIDGYIPGNMRLNIIRCNGLIVINDVYNASPQSVKAAIDVLDEIEAGRRIAVLGDMLELGSWSADAHRETGAYVAGSRTDLLIAVGKAAAHIAEGAAGAGFPGSRTAVLANNGEAIRYLQGIVRRGDAILVKGSRGMMMEEIVNALVSG
ncbi:MAG: UDP-N-acetylmuramoyl-tripeptide--D-alanyl-D-alanine ligase [Clostridiaceae bacterium]|nr:UDP-N-acetylmuramoyl-tripeptide--D-alanyl-D-alanine ligase [Clostridiaceae bacterium]